MSTDRHTQRLKDANGQAADHQSDTPERRPYEAPQLRHHSKLPVITAGSISKSSWGFGPAEQGEETS